MTQSADIAALIRLWEDNAITFGELQSQLMALIWKLPVAERHAALETLSGHANADIRTTASEFKILMRNEALSKNLDYVRQNSPLRPGVRLELFGGYDYYSTEGKPWWLNGHDCYKATFLGFAPRGDDKIPAGLVEFDEVLDLPGHNGRYGVLLTSYGLDSAALGRTDDTVTVFVTAAPTKDLSSMRLDRDSIVPYGGLSFLIEHDLFRKPVSTPDQVRGRHFRDHALRPP